MTYTFIARALLGPAGRGVLSGDEGVDLRLLRVASPARVSDRDWDDAVLTNTIVDIHRMSRRSYGSPRVHAELRLGLEDVRCSRKRVERLMRQAGVAGHLSPPRSGLHPPRPGRGARR